MQKKALLFDSAAIFFRSYYAFIHNPLLNKEGQNVSAVFGFINTILRIIVEENPLSVICAFDRKEPTFRHALYSEYKANRESMPEELVSQLPLIHEFLSVFGLREMSLPGYEADDVLGTLSKQFIDTHAYDEVVIATGDKDLFQLLNPNVKIYNLRHLSKQKEQHYFTDTSIKELYKIASPLIRDYLALIGDTSDNIPGVPGIGPKTATKLLLQFGTLQEIYSHYDLIKPDKLRDKLLENRDKAFLSYELTRIVENLLLPEYGDSFLTDIKPEAAMLWLKQKEFPSLVSLVEKLKTTIHKKDDAFMAHKTDEKSDPFILVPGQNLDHVPDFIQQAKTLMVLKIRMGISDQCAWLLSDLAGAYMILEDQCLEKIMSILKGRERSARIMTVGCKQFSKELLQRRIPVCRELQDMLLAYYLLNPEDKAPNFMACLKKYASSTAFSDLLVLACEAIDENHNVFSLDHNFEIPGLLQATGQVSKVLWKELSHKNLDTLYRDLELPFCTTLAEVENNGILMDMQYLIDLSQQTQSQLKLIETQIFDFTGEAFNISSPKQLGVILFEKLKIQMETGIKKVKKGKTGYATGSEILDQYAHIPIVKLIMEYRKLCKIDNTYLTPLREYIIPSSQSIKPCLNQMVAITGRLSSSNPNLQNIPIRSPEGANIRKAFKPSRGKLMLSADYSQIELRILAHFSKDPNMLDAFRASSDIHRQTAALIFKIREDEVSSEKRSQAKAINFGVIYGMGPHRLSKETNLTFQEASHFISDYFNVYQGVKRYIDSQIQLARDQSYVTTLMGRRRDLPDIHSDRQDKRINAEHMAVNTPIQGSAAELIKQSMNRVSVELNHHFPDVCMLLQIHDELLFEVPESDVDAFKIRLKTIMESAFELDVPLLVQMGVGRNWLEAH